MSILLFIFELIYMYFFFVHINTHKQRTSRKKTENFLFTTLTSNIKSNWSHTVVKTKKDLDCLDIQYVHREMMMKQHQYEMSLIQLDLMKMVVVVDDDDDLVLVLLKT